MTQYLVAIHHPENFEAGSEDAATHADIDRLNDEMNAAGVVVFVGGLGPARQAKSVRLLSGGKLKVHDGPYIETKEHIGGFWVLEAPDMETALHWGRKAAIACRAPVEVRAFI